MKNDRLDEIRLTLFFTADLSMQLWADLGMIDREMAIYDRLSRELKEVNIVTYGDRRDSYFSKDYAGVNIMPTRWFNSPIRTAGLLLMKYFSKIYRSDVLKTNQIPGSEIPLWLKRKFRKKLIVRCGYLFSYMTMKQTDDEDIVESAVKLERDAFENADMGIVTTSWQRKIVLDNYNVSSGNIKVIPNYVVTEIFAPDPTTEKKYDLIFVGRSGTQKNLYNLLEALFILRERKRSYSLLMVGSCCDDKEIRERANHDGLDVTLMGNVPNYQLPVFLNQSRVCILPSLYEGHPKVLLEAMSCGLPCIGADVDGIRQEIDHGKSGFLCDTDPVSISRAVETVLSDEMLQRSLGEKARTHIHEHYSLDRVLQLELEVLREVAEK
jgi:glycosyltransferase involved in cell wall biosynthesis